MGPFLVSEGQQHVPISRVSVSGVFLRTHWTGSVPTELIRVRSSWSHQTGFPWVQQLSRFSDALTSFAVRLLRNHHQSRGFRGCIVWSCSVAVCMVPCHLGWVDVILDLVLRWHVGLLCVDRCSASTNKLDQRTSFLAVVRHISVLNNWSLPRFPLFHSQRLCEFVSCRDGVCGEGVLLVQPDVIIVLLC